MRRREVCCVVDQLRTPRERTNEQDFRRLRSGHTWMQAYMLLRRGGNLPAAIRRERARVGIKGEQVS